MIGCIRRCNPSKGANASSSSSTLIWEKGGRGSGGPDDDGGDVFLSTTLNMGCGGGYYGSQVRLRVCVRVRALDVGS